MFRASQWFSLLAFTVVATAFHASALASQGEAPAAAKCVAITIDDLPVINPEQHTPEEQTAIIRAMTATLSRHHVPATGFVISKNLRPYHHDSLTAFVQEGNVIGNHSFSHMSPHKVPITEYLSDIEKGQKAIREWPGKTKYYRFPMLLQGRSESEYTQIQRYLLRYGYVTAHVTIDNDDWSFNRDYIAALNSSDTGKAKSVARDYLEHMKEQTHHFELRAQEVAGRPIKQVLLVHMSKINADHLGELLSWYESDGYQFISLAEALQDPIYGWTDRFRGENGISWLDRIIEPEVKN